MGTGSRRGAEALGRRIAVAVPFVVVNPSLIPSRRRGFARNLFRGVKTSREAARARRRGGLGAGRKRSGRAMPLGVRGIHCIDPCGVAVRLSGDLPFISTPTIASCRPGHGNRCSTQRGGRVRQPDNV